MRKLQFILLMLAFVCHIGIMAQSNNGRDRAIVFEEDFNGWTSIEDEGWFMHNPVGWNMISPNDNAITFFKQDVANWMMLITPEIDLTNATMLTFSHKRGSSVDGQKLEIGTMSDPTDPSTFVLLNIVNIDSSEWTTYGSQTVLSGVNGVTHIAFNVAASSPPLIHIYGLIMC